MKPVNRKLSRQFEQLAGNVERRNQSEKILVLGIVCVGIVLLWLSLAFDPLQAGLNTTQARINAVNRQIVAQQTAYAAMEAASQQDPNKFANDRLQVLQREQARLDDEIQNLAGDLVTPSQMIPILTLVLERQAGLQLLSFKNLEARPLRSGVSNAAQILTDTGAVNFESTSVSEVSGQVYEHGLIIEFEGDFFSTLRYLRVLEQMTGSFFWDAVSFRQLEWPNAHITLEIHTLSTDQGFMGV